MHRTEKIMYELEATGKNLGNNNTAPIVREYEKNTMTSNYRFTVYCGNERMKWLRKNRQKSRRPRSAHAAWSLFRWVLAPLKRLQRHPIQFSNRQFSRQCMRWASALCDCHLCRTSSSFYLHTDPSAAAPRSMPMPNVACITLVISLSQFSFSIPIKNMSIEQ